MQKRREEARKGSVLSPQSSVLLSLLDRIIFIDLLATVVLAPLAYGTVEAWSIALFELNALLLAVLLAGRFALDNRSRLSFPRLLLPLLALLLLGALQVIPWGQAARDLAAPENIRLAELGPATLSLDSQATREATVKLLALIIYFVAAVNTLGQGRRRDTTLVVIVTLGFALAVFGITQRLTWNGKIYWVRPIREGLIAFGPFVNPNHFAGAMGLLFPFAFAHAVFGRLKAEQRALWLFAAVMMAAAVVLSLSRGGAIALGAELAAFSLGVILSRRKEFRQLRSAVVGRALIPATVAAVVMITFWVGYDQIAARWRAVGEGAQEISIAKRLEIWRDSWRMFRDYPVCGVGLGAFPTAYSAYGRSSVERERVEQAHNDYLQLLTDGGMVGGAIGLWFLVELLLAARREWQVMSAGQGSDRSLAIGGFIAVLGLMIHSLIDFNLQITSNALLFLLAIALVVTHESTPARRKI